MKNENNNKRKTRNVTVNENENENENENDTFNIDDYDITDLQSLINLINDLILKKPPGKIMKKQLPIRLYKLIDIQDSLIELNNLIGLEKLKQQLLEQLIFFVQETTDGMLLHTVIEGPPGTGKTTVAQIMANIYSGIGILKKNKLTLVKREDLIGQYLGETTIKTSETLNRCKNGVMLIDEAYSLGSPDNHDSFAKEAIDCINQYLTENSDKLICIIAGYKYELQRYFFAQNPGLQRRFPWTFTIESFTNLELSKILIKKIDDTDDYILDKDIDEDYLSALIKKEYFSGNAGDIDTIFSRIKIINARINFGRYAKNTCYILTKNMIEEAIGKFYENRKDKIDRIPGLMYT